MDSHKGFTLIELITVMVIIGILAAMTSNIILFPMRSYITQQLRNTMEDNIESALLLTQRDIRRALPNSIRITNNGKALELLHLSDGGRYREYVTTVGDDILDFTQADTSFDVIGSLSAVPSGSVVIYNLGNSLANAYTGNNLATISNTSKINSVVFSSKLFPLQSPQQRFYIVDTPISYGCDLVAGTLTRYDSYSINTIQSYPPANASAALQANNVSACLFSYSSSTATRSGLVTLQLTLTNSAGESSTLLHQVHVDNTP